MLVALDNSDIAKLAEAMRGNAPGAAAFLASWKAHGCELAINQLVLNEMVLVPREVLQNRLVLLEQLEPLYGIPDSRVVDEFEIEAQAEAILEGRDLGDIASTIRKGQSRIFRRVSRSEIEERIRQWRKPAEILRQQMQAIAEVANFGRVQGRAWPLTAEIAMGREALRQGLEKAARWKYPEPVARSLIDDLDRQVDCIFAHQNDERAYLKCLLEIEGMIGADNAPLDDLHTAFAPLAKQRHVIPRFLRSRGRNKPDLEQEIFNKLDPYRMPGISLRIAAFRELQRDVGRTRESSDFPDALQLTAAPYTDLTCVDKRTFAFIRQARTGRERHLVCPGVGDNLIDARSFSAVATAIAGAASASQARKT